MLHHNIQLSLYKPPCRHIREYFPKPQIKQNSPLLETLQLHYFGTYSILYLAVLENKEESGTIDVRVGNLEILEFQINNFLADMKVRK